MRAFSAIIASATLLCAFAAPAWSTDFCVTCAGPEAHYTCTYDDASADPTDSRLKLNCITELAKAGQHATCSVDRTQKAPCGGPVKILAMPGGLEVAPAPGAVVPNDHSGTAAVPPAAPGSQPAPQQSANETAVPKDDAPPKTVEEMVKKGTASTGEALEKTGETAVEAAKTTGSAIGNAGKAVGDAAKKTWNCITSLFGNC